MKILKLPELLFFVIFLLHFPSQAPGQEKKHILFGEMRTIHSDLLNEEREYWIHLPESYDRGSQSYPVMYITDGSDHFYLAGGIVDFLSFQSKIPELIIVAVFQKDRNYDLTPTRSAADRSREGNDAPAQTGGGEKFLRFIEEELIVQVEKDYRTKPFRILAGHSMGGLLAVYSYLTRSDLFNAYIVMDPALFWDDFLCLKMLQSMSSASPNFRNRLYLSSAHNSKEKRDTTPFRKSQDAFCRELEKKKIAGYRQDYFEDDNHMIVPYHGLYSGLSYIFDGHYIFSNYVFAADSATILDHFSKVSGRLGMECIPSEGLIQMIGNYFLNDGREYRKAIELFRISTSCYPGSYKAHEYLGKAYRANGNTGDAVASLERSLEINPENTEIRMILQELSKE